MKKQPEAIDLEVAVLGALLLDREAFGIVCDILRPESFYAPAHPVIYRAIETMSRRNDPVDILTVSEYLRATGELDGIGGGSYLIDLTNRVASAANIEYHARIIAEKSMARRTIKLAETAIEAAYDPGSNPFDLIEALQKGTFDMLNLGGRATQSAGQIAPDVMRRILQAMNGTGITGVTSGFSALDKVTGGWQGGELIILAARPAMGKTALALTLAQNAATAGTGVGFFSLEMPSVQLVSRLVAMLSGISGSDLRHGRLAPKDIDRAQQAATALEGVPLYIDESSGLTLFELSAKARRMVSQYGIGMLIVDYLQLMRDGDKKAGNREQEIAAISRGLKALAKDLNIPIIALAQLSRGVETRADKRPKLSDLRESGSIEQDADIVIFIYREDYYDNSESISGPAELLIEKHRNGPQATVGLHYDAPLTLFLSEKKPEFMPASSLDYTIPANARPDVDADIPF